MLHIHVDIACYIIVCINTFMRQKCAPGKDINYSMKTISCLINLSVLISGIASQTVAIVP